MGRNDFDRRGDGRSPMKGGMMNPNRGGGYMNRGGGFSNRGGQQNRGGPQRGGMPQRGGPGGRGSQQNNRGGQQRPRGGSQSGNTITVTPNKNITQVKTDKTVTPPVVKEEKKTPVKTDSQASPATNTKSEKTTPQSQKSTPQTQNFKSPPPRPQQSPAPRSTASPNSNNMRTSTPQKPQQPTQPRATSTPDQSDPAPQSQKPQQNQGKAQQNQERQQNQGRSQMQQHNENRNQSGKNQNQRDFRNNRGDRSFSQNRRDRNENRYQDRGQSHDSMMEGQMNAPKEEKKFTMRCRLFVGNLTAETTEEEFKTMFEPFGELNEVYLNPQRGFGFCRLDYRSNAEAAKAAIDGTMRKGRTLRVRFASHGAALKVRNLSPFVSNELLESAFSQLGEVERAIVICDDRGKSTGEGVVEFARKQVALGAIKRINDGAFLLTASPRPIFVEPLEQKDEEDGLAEKFIPRNDQYRKERELEPRFAPPGSFEFSFASKWKQIVEMEKNQMEQVKRNVEEAKLKLEGEMENAQMEHQEELLRKDLMRQQEELRRLQEIRQQNELRRRQEMEMRMRQQEEDERIRQEHQQRRQDMMMRRNDNLRHPMGGDTMGQDDMMMGQGGIHELPGSSNRGNAPPLPPPPAPPASMGLDRGRSQMSGGMASNYGNQGMGGPPVGMGGDTGMGGPGGQMERQGMYYDNGLSQFDGPSANNYGGAGNSFQSQGNIGSMGGGMGSVTGPSNMYQQGGMGGNINTQGMRGNDRGMDRRREGGPREDYGDMKRMRRF